MPVIDVPADARVSPSGVVSADQNPGLTFISNEIQWPMEIQFGGLLDPRLSFRKPVQVTLYKDEHDVYVARSVQVDQFGYGSNAAEALDDLGKTLSEMYFYLSDSSEAGSLGESLAAQHALLSEFIGTRYPQKHAA
jgi:hypothetical protein